MNPWYHKTKRRVFPSQCVVAGDGGFDFDERELYDPPSKKREALDHSLVKAVQKAGVSNFPVKMTHREHPRANSHMGLTQDETNGRIPVILGGRRTWRALCEAERITREQGGKPEPIAIAAMIPANVRGRLLRRIVVTDNIAGMPYTHAQMVQFVAEEDLAQMPDAELFELWPTMSAADLAKYRSIGAATKHKDLLGALDAGRLELSTAARLAEQHGDVQERIFRAHPTGKITLRDMESAIGKAGGFPRRIRPSVKAVRSMLSRANGAMSERERALLEYGATGNPDLLAPYDDLRSLLGA